MKLTKVSNWIWAYFILILMVSIGIIFFILTYKIEKLTNVVINVDENRKLYIVGQHNVLYNLEVGQNLTLDLENKHYIITIENFKYKNDGIIINFSTNEYQLIEKLKPNMTLNSKLIYGTTTLFNKLFLT